MAPDSPSSSRKVRTSRRLLTVILFVLTLLLLGMSIASAFRGLGLFISTGETIYFTAFADGLIGAGWGKDSSASGIRLETQKMIQWHWGFRSNFDPSRTFVAAPIWFVMLLPMGVLTWQAVTTYLERRRAR